MLQLTSAVTNNGDGWLVAEQGSPGRPCSEPRSKSTFQGLALIFLPKSLLARVMQEPDGWIILRGLWVMGGCVAVCRSQQEEWPLSAKDPRTRDRRVSALPGWTILKVGPSGYLNQRPHMVPIRSKLGSNSTDSRGVSVSHDEPVDFVHRCTKCCW